MSTPYVGLKRVFQGEAPQAEKTWQGEDPFSPKNPWDYKAEVKQRLLNVLETKLGVQSVLVGAFQMTLSENIPERHLIKATHFLVEQYKQENMQSDYIAILEECVQTLLKK